MLTVGTDAVAVEARSLSASLARPPCGAALTPGATVGCGMSARTPASFAGSGRSTSGRQAGDEPAVCG